MDFDADALLCPWALDVDVGLILCEIPALPARDWLLALLRGQTGAVVPGLVADRSALNRAILDDLVTAEDCVSAARAALAAAAGCPWWVAERLGLGILHSGLAMELVLRGVDPERVSLAAYLAGGYRLATAALPTDRRQVLDWTLERPPEGIDPAEWFDEDKAAASFEAAYAAHGGDYDQGEAD